jgi:hypothetical protein
MDMKRHMLIFFFSYPCWWIWEESEINIKMEVVIKKGGRKRKHLFIKNEKIKLENEVVILKIVFGMVHG